MTQQLRARFATACVACLFAGILIGLWAARPAGGPSAPPPVSPSKIVITRNTVKSDLVVASERTTLDVFSATRYSFAPDATNDAPSYVRRPRADERWVISIYHDNDKISYHAEPRPD